MESIMVALSEKRLFELGGSSMKAAVTRLAALAAGVFAGGILAASPARTLPAAPPRNASYKDAGLSVDVRVEDLLARMTLEEKVAQMQSIWDNKGTLFDAKLELDPKKMALNYPDGIGQFARPSDATGPASPRLVPGRALRGTIRLVNALQHYALEHTRLGIPIMFHEEGLHGYVAAGATSFPQAIALASSWDPALVRAVNVVTAREMRARGVTEALTPVVDVARDPRWGRIEETFGEDPYLVGEMGVAAVEGLQGRGKGWRGGRRTTGRGQGVGLGTRQGFRNFETSHRPWPTRKRHECRAGALLGTRSARILLPAVRKDHRAHRRQRRHAVLQRDRRRAEQRECLAVAKSIARRVGLQGCGGERLLRHRGPAETASHCRNPRRGRAARAQSRRRYRPTEPRRLRHADATGARRPRARVEHRRRGAPAADAQVARRFVRASLRRCRAGASGDGYPGRARAGTEVGATRHRAAEERRHSAAAAPAREDTGDRGDRAERRGGAARRLRGPAAAHGGDTRWHPRQGGRAGPGGVCGGGGK